MVYASLFRPEVRDARTSLTGDVVLIKSKSESTLTILLLLVTVGLAIWAGSASYNRIEAAQGELTPVGDYSKIFASRAGVVSRLLVREGEAVKAGQPIAIVNVEQPLMRGASPTGGVLEAIGDEQRLLQSELTHEDARDSSERARLHDLIARMSEERDTLDNQLKAQQQVVTSARNTFETFEKLANAGLATKTDLETHRQAFLSANQGVSEIVQRIAELDERLGTSRSDLAELPISHDDKISQIHLQAESLNERSIDSENGQGYLIKAAIAGRITSLQIKVGEYVDARLPLLSIVPSASPLEATLFAPSKAIGLAKVGDLVRISYDAFPVERFGSFPARIESISRTVLSPAEVDAPFKIDGPVYRVAVRLQDQTVSAFGKQIALQPGMTLKGNIILDERSFLDWLLEPIEAVRGRA